MRRWALLAVALVVLVGCAQEARPTGVVEHWLRSLNQGAAGRPDRYAPQEVSAQVLPGWADLEPGRLDRIEVSAPAVDTPADVPFRVVDIDGAATAGTAHLEPADDTWRVTSVELVAADLATTTSVHGGAPPRGWALAAVGAVALSVLAVVALAAVRRGAQRT